MQQSNYEKKVYVIQRIRLVAVEGELLRPDMGASPGDAEYRLAYYIVNRNDRWQWGESAPMIPVEDLRPLLESIQERSAMHVAQDPTGRGILGGDVRGERDRAPVGELVDELDHTE